MTSSTQQSWEVVCVAIVSCVWSGTVQRLSSKLGTVHNCSFWKQPSSQLTSPELLYIIKWLVGDFTNGGGWFKQLLCTALKSKSLEKELKFHVIRKWTRHDGLIEIVQYYDWKYDLVLWNMSVSWKHCSQYIKPWQGCILGKGFPFLVPWVLLQQKLLCTQNWGEVCA